MTVEQYLSLSDEDIEYMISVNCGSTASSPWCGSVVKKPGRYRVSDEDVDEEENEGLSEDELDLDDDSQYEMESDNMDLPDSEN